MQNAEREGWIERHSEAYMHIYTIGLNYTGLKYCLDVFFYISCGVKEGGKHDGIWGHHDTNCSLLEKIKYYSPFF